MFSSLILRQSRKGCRFHVRKIQILLIFSWVNDFSKKISKKMIWNDLLGVVVKYVTVHFFTENLCFDQNLLCFVSLYLPRSCFVLVADNNANISCLICLISKLFILGNIIFNSASCHWINYQLPLVNNFWY